MSPFIAELLGTLFLILLGNGVVANVVLSQSKGSGGGWIVIAFGWAMAVFVGVYVATHGSAAHLNPAVTIAMAAFNGFPWADVPIYLAGQLIGAMAGSCLVWLTYRQHFDATADAGLQQACFCTAPAIPNKFYNFISEMIGTMVLLLGVLFMTKSANSLGTLDALPVGLLVLAIGLSLGGPTGYAINPARDLGPRIMHAILPMKNKGDSNWGYSWVPVIAPIVGALLAVWLYKNVLVG
ncbi:MAG: MIP/aquaporin family protein [Chitinophagaceae bacterium]